MDVLQHSDTQCSGRYPSHALKGGDTERDQRANEIGGGRTVGGGSLDDGGMSWGYEKYFR
jgi:hypothetical protein